MIRTWYKILCSIFVSIALAGYSVESSAALSPDQRSEVAMHSFDYHGISIKYTDEGAGRPLIFLHGFGASSYSWRYLTRHFSENYRVIAVDLKGFGLSDKPFDNRYSLREQALIIKSFIENKSLRDVVLVGNSFGGAVAMMTCLEFSGPQSPIRKMVLIDSPASRQDMPNIFALLRTPPFNWLAISLMPPRVAAWATLEKDYFNSSKISDEAVLVYASYLKLPGARSALLRTAEQLVPPNLNHILERYREVTMPVLILWGEEDRTIPLSTGRLLASEIRNSRLMVIPNCGHLPQEECPEQTIEFISDFLSDDAVAEMQYP